MNLNFAIIGTGVIAPLHGVAIRESSLCALYAVCDILPDKAEAFAKEYGAQKVYTDYGDVMKDPKVDVVCVCVPSGLHGEVCLAASRAGKHIVCEKPMEINGARIEEIIFEVERSGVKMQCIFQRRLMPIAIEVRRLVAEGRLGRICLAGAYLRYYRDQAYYNSAGWRGTWDLDGGGALMNQGVHGVDLLIWMLGDKVTSVFGRADTLARDILVEDTAVALLKMQSGAMAVIEGATTTYPGFSTTFCIHGEKGTVSFNDEGVLEWAFLDADNAPPKPDTGEAVVGNAPSQLGSAGHNRLIHDMAEAVLHNRETMIPPREARGAVELICAIYESSKKGQEVVFS